MEHPAEADDDDSQTTVRLCEPGKFRISWHGGVVRFDGCKHGGWIVLFRQEICKSSGLIFASARCCGAEAGWPRCLAALLDLNP